MPNLRNEEVRRLLKHLREQIQDTEKLAYIEDELRSNFGVEFLREPEILSYFHSETVSVGVWQLKIISYTQMRMTQRGIRVEEIINLFERFLHYCEAEQQLISIGAYTIFGKSAISGHFLTLRIDVDTTNEAHTVTIFIGRGDTTQTTKIELLS